MNSETINSGSFALKFENGSPASATGNTVQKEVNFGQNTADKSTVYIEKKNKFLTAKYDKQAMNLIKHRLAVEDFLYDELRDLHGCTNDEDDHDCDIDLDDLLDVATEEERRLVLEEKLSAATAAPARIEHFICALLEKLKSL